VQSLPHVRELQTNPHDHTHDASRQTGTVGVYTERVLPRLVDLALAGKPFEEVRARVAAGLEGEVLEIGFGSGRNVTHYPQGVERVRVVEPAEAGMRMAAERIRSRGIPVESVGVDGETLPLEDDSVDHVLTTWTLCTIPDVERALEEIRRVLRPGGRLHFAEHGLSPRSSIARWQDRLTPIQKRLAGGCHLNRPIDEIVAACGLELTTLDNFRLPGPELFGYMYEGTATKVA
jgi:SAM-dependent methyltransferase